MPNIEVYAPAADGSRYSIHEKGEPCAAAVEALFTDDFAAPPICLTLKVHTEHGKVVEVIIPYDTTSMVKVKLDGEAI